MRIKHLSKIYNTRYEDIVALEDISLVLPEKGLVFIVGVSGSGKTTLMNMLSRVDKPTKGDITIGDKSLFAETKETKNQMYGYRNSYVGLIFQDYNLIEDLNVYDNIKISLELMGRSDYETVDEVIKKIDIEDIKYSNVDEISSGQMQRVAIARALVKDASLVLADEPTGNLDSKNEKIIFDLLKEISNDRLVVVITHDDEAAKEYGDRIIEIEDGEITNDTNPIEKYEEKTPEFVDPKLSFAEQMKFTIGFIKNNLSRSLSIFLILLLVPIIGGILASYVFFDVSVSFRDYQEEYNSDYVSLSQKVNNYNLYYEPQQIVDMYNEYPQSRLIEYYDTYININPNNYPENKFYKPVIKNIVIYNRMFDYEGRLPENDREILITDYVAMAIDYYQASGSTNKLVIDGLTYDIVGTVTTNYRDFLDADFDEQYVQMAFNDNLDIYNSIFTTYSGYSYLLKNVDSYQEIARLTLTTGRVEPVIKYEEFMVYREGTRNYNLLTKPLASNDDLGTNGALVSRAFYEEVLELSLDNSFSINATQGIFYSYSKTNYRLTFRVSGVYESDEYEVILNSPSFSNNVNKFNHSRLMIHRDDANYSSIVNNENVTNGAFLYASAMADKAQESKIVMIEFLIVLILIVGTFSVIINSSTIKTEKKKIGIKYSFGLKKFPIIVPYIIEYAIYILITFILSSIIVKWVFPFFMKNIIYSKPEDIMIFDFFYVAWLTIIGWDILVYAIMLLSLLVMIIRIYSKSPIEIIKDL